RLIDSQITSAVGTEKNKEASMAISRSGMEYSSAWRRARRGMGLADFIGTPCLLEQLGSQRYGLVRHAKSHLALFVMKTGHQTFRHQRPDLLFGEVHHRHHLFADQLLWRV